MALYMPVSVDSSLLEFGNSIPDGLHRCTTKTSNWFLKPEVFQPGDLKEDNFRVFCSLNTHVREKDCNETSTTTTTTEMPEKNCNRIYHLYRMKSINAILIVAETPRTTSTVDGVYDEFSDMPVEG